ncbi:MAG: hypothetical protein JJT78_09565 [Leptospira sp.]|nr:hypothetical protein [Leptospira sp.]
MTTLTIPSKVDQHLCYDPNLDEFLRLPKLGGWDILKRETVFYCTAWKRPILVLENFRLPRVRAVQPVQIFAFQEDNWLEIHHNGEITSEEQDRIIYSHNSQSLIQVANRRTISTALIINRLSLVQDIQSIHETNIRLGRIPGSEKDRPLEWKTFDAVYPGSFCLEVGEDTFRNQLVFFLENQMVGFKDGKFFPLGEVDNLSLANTPDSGRVFILKDRIYFCNRVGRPNMSMPYDTAEIYSMDLDGTGYRKISPPGVLHIGSLDCNLQNGKIMGIHWEMTAKYPTPEFMVYDGQAWETSPNTIDRFSAYRLSTNHIYLFQQCKILGKTHYRIAKANRKDFPNATDPSQFIDLSHVHGGKVSLEYLPPFEEFYEMGMSKNISINDFFTVGDDLYLLSALGAIWILDQDKDEFHKQWKQIMDPPENFEPHDNSAIFIDTNFPDSNEFKLYVYGGSQVDMRTNSAQKIGKELWIFNFPEKSWSQEKLTGKIPALFFPGYQGLAMREGHFVKDANTGDYIVTGGELVSKEEENEDTYLCVKGKWSKK